MVIVALPLLIGHIKTQNSTVSERTQTYIASKNLMVNGADAFERIMTSYKEVRRTNSTIYLN